MTVLTSRPTALDLVRSVVVVLLAVAQIVVSAFAGSGIGAVATAYPSPVLAAGWTFSIWGLIYLGFLAYAAFQLVPGQRGRRVHRRSGWWLAVSALANMAWIAAFGTEHLLLAETALILLTVVLTVVFVRLSADPSESGLEQIVFRLPVSLYTGWVAAALIQGTLTTGVWIGLPSDGALTIVASIVLLVGLTLTVVAVANSASGIAGLVAAVVWALAGVVANDRPVAVTLVAVAALAFVAVTAIRRIARSVQPRRVALG
ncbi:MAG: hypothetical protein M3235_12625 [Actinomycetota bacterium]|nr:hypothetical protein [Actinomycetota bacterium]